MNRVVWVVLFLRSKNMPLFENFSVDFVAGIPRGRIFLAQMFATESQFLAYGRFLAQEILEVVAVGRRSGIKVPAFPPIGNRAAFSTAFTLRCSAGSSKVFYKLICFLLNSLIAT